MSGKRQHFIPRFLQRGFASHVVGEQVFTWVYRKGTAAFSSNIMNVGVEGAFYSEDDDTQTDDIITEAETTFSALVAKLKASKPGSTGDPQLPALVAHLEVRTRSLRQCFAASADYLGQQICGFLANEEAFVDFVLRKLQREPAMLRDLVHEECEKRGLPPDAQEQMMPIIRSLLPAWLEQIKPRLPEFLDVFRSRFTEGMPKALKSGHLRALKKDIAPERKVQHYTTLSYALLDLRDDSLILGDSPVVFEVDGARRYKTLIEKGNILKSVYLPLTPRRLLLGTCSAPNPDVADISKVVARCSLEHFISHRRCEANDLLKGEIGQDAYLLSKKQIQDIWTGILSE